MWTERAYLPYLIFETTWRCNLDCRYCYNTWKIPGKGVTFDDSYTAVKRTLARLFKIARVGNISMTGGEPMLARRFPELVLFCRMKGASVSVISNGTAAEPEAYRELDRLGIDAYQFPLLSADPMVHDRLTGVRGSWERAVRVIREMLPVKEEVLVMYVITSENCREAEKLFGFIEEMGVKKLMLLRYNLGGGGASRYPDLPVKGEDLRSVFSAAEKYAAAGRLSITSNVCTPFCVLPPENYPHIAFTACTAEIRKRPLTLDGAGNMRACNHSPVLLGNIHRDSIKSILDSDLTAEWNEVPEICSACERYAQCLGGCRASAEQLGLPAREGDPYLLCR